jgi:glycosyltransferase involved in cell wall biosynthesis
MKLYSNEPGLVTILIPNLNGMPYLKAAIQSCLSQSYPCKILIVDNGSTDGSLEYLQEIQKIQPNIRFIHEGRRGISSALNCGLLHTDTKYVARLDADDVMVESRIMRQVDYLEENPKCLVVGSQLVYINEDGVQTGQSTYPESQEDLIRSISFSNPIAHPSVMFRRKEILQLGSYDERLNGAEDLDLWLRCINSGTITNLPFPLTRYRQHGLQISRSKKSISAELRVRTRGMLNPFSLNHLRGFNYILNLVKILELLSRFIFWNTKIRFPRSLKNLVLKYAR